MTYVRDGQEWLNANEMAVYRAVCKLAGQGRAANNSQVSNASGINRTAVVYITTTLRRRGYIKDVSPTARNAYSWRPTGKEARLEPVQPGVTS